MASFNVESMFNSMSIELAQKCIKKSWNSIKKYSKLPLKEFLNGLDVLMNSKKRINSQQLSSFFY